MAYTTIDNPELYFQVKLYTGNGTDDTAITLDGDENMSPNLIWIKPRNDARGHHLQDTIRGVNNALIINESSAEYTGLSNVIKSFDSDGFTLGTSNDINKSSNTHVAWCWKAGTSFTNDASATSIGSIDSSGSASSDAGFSIVSWTGNDSDATIKHGLSTAPQIYILKNRSDDSTDWRVAQTVAGNTMTGGNGYYMELNDTKGSTNPGSAVTWGSTPTAPTSSVFTVGSHNSHNGNSDGFIAYCWHSVQGFSKIGGYTGNGNVDGSFVYTGFRPAFIMIKQHDADGTDWTILDNKRPVENPADQWIAPNTNAAEVANDTTALSADLLSNGFKLRGSASDGTNGSSDDFIYMAFAEAPFVNSNGVPCNAR